MSISPTVTPTAKERFISMRNILREAVPVDFDYVPRGGEYFETAQISSKLVDLINKVWDNSPSESRQLFVLGNDGEYLSSGAALWRTFLVDAAKNINTKVVYILLNASKQVRQELKSLLQNVEGNQLSLLEPKRGADIPEDIQLLFKRSETHHFVIGNSPKFLWLEGEHKRQENEATNCVFLDSNLCSTNPEWNIYFQTLKNKILPNLVPMALD